MYVCIYIYIYIYIHTHMYVTLILGAREAADRELEGVALDLLDLATADEAGMARREHDLHQVLWRCTSKGI